MAVPIFVYYFMNSKYFLKHFCCVCVCVCVNFSSVQSLSHVRLFVTPWTGACQASLSITDSWSLLKLMSIKSMMLSNHLILCHPLLLLPSIFPSFSVFSNEPILFYQVAEILEFQLSISSSSKYSQLIFYRIPWWLRP